MHNSRLADLRSRFLPLRPWYFFVLAGLSFLIGVIALRGNYVHMTELRDAVYAADKDGSDVQKPLAALQQYVTTHMNTNLSGGSNSVYPPIQLKYTYERLREANAKASNAQVYNDAQTFCESQNSSDFSGRNRVPCIESYVESHGVQQKEVPDALYKYDFLSPVWSPDLAGISLLIGVVSSCIGAGWLLLRRFLRD